ncbi:MAG: NADH-quinone oxidoreductase subunit J [Acidimicrobiia bacterium]|nr:NADH-quinone oxidoreductase subunit J [Acidimicrobiia bacterium]
MTAVVTAADTLVAQNIFFYVIAAVMVFGAIRLVTTKNIVHAALYLVLVLIGVAANFVLTMGEFAAATQVLVYVGAIIVLFLFGIMLTQARIGREVDVDQDKRWVAGLTAALLGAVMVFALVDAFETTDIREGPRVGVEVGSELAVQTTEAVADSIFSDYLIPFEALSLLLLAALIGAIVVARRE